MPAPDLDELVTVAARLAEDAGNYLLAGLHRARQTVETKSSATDMVTEMDRGAERRIVEGLAQLRPDDGILGEEGAQRPATSGVRWIVDPLDGTTNYLYGFPAFAVSMAAEIDGEIQAGAVYDPSHREGFTAARGRGAWCNGERLQVKDPSALATALVATGFSYTPERRTWQVELLARVIAAVRDVRRAGAASVDLCWVAAGRLDAFYEHGLAYWDYAAGSLIASEAGAEVTDLAGGPPSSTLVVAATPGIAPQLRTLLSDAIATVEAETGI